MSVVFYFMKGCPACEATWPAWEKVKKSLGKTKEVESKQVPPEKNVQSFPTFIVEDENGVEIKRVEGRRTLPAELLHDLGMQKKKKTKSRKGGRRHSRARTTRRRIR
jgi:hypothetical protein